VVDFPFFKKDSFEPGSSHPFQLWICALEFVKTVELFIIVAFVSLFLKSRWDALESVIDKGNSYKVSFPRVRLWCKEVLELLKKYGAMKDGSVKLVFIRGFIGAMFEVKFGAEGEIEGALENGKFDGLKDLHAVGNNDDKRELESCVPFASIVLFSMLDES